MDTNTDQLIEALNTFETKDVPPWAILMISGMKTILTEFTSIKGFIDRIENLENTNATNQGIIETLQLENSRLSDELKNVEVRIDDQEQRSRNSCLLFHGIEEKQGETTDDAVLKVINEDLNKSGITIDEIQVSHRLGPKRMANTSRATRSSKVLPRPIIVRFTNCRTRRDIFSSKRLLKGKPISISENLTQKRVELLKAAGIKLGKGNVWTTDGRITTKINDSYIVINSFSELHDIVT